MNSCLRKISSAPEQEESVTAGHKQKIMLRVSDILSQDFQHPYSPIKKTTLQSLVVSELTKLHDFLTEANMNSPNPIPRPTCPIKHANHQSAATHTYKQAMIEYIKGFGYALEKSPCTYPPSFLEALANYCEHRIGAKRKVCRIVP